MSGASVTELLLDNAGLSHQAKLMMLTATHGNPNFETASWALIRQDGRVHIRERQSGPSKARPWGEGSW